MASFDSADLLVNYKDEKCLQTVATQQATLSLSVSYKQKVDGKLKKGTFFSGLYPAAFGDFLLKPELIKSHHRLWFEKPSEVQQACIPIATQGMDVLCQAKSGMSKTDIYVLSTLQQIEPTGGVVSVLMPSKYQGAFLGGTPMSHDTEILKDKLRYPSVVIDTVDRTLALVCKKHLELHGLKYLIIDECVHMLARHDSRRDIKEIHSAAPRDKQAMIFLATLPVDLRDICKQLLENPLEVDNQELKLFGFQQFYVEVSEQDKIRFLFKLLDAISFN